MVCLAHCTKRIRTANGARDFRVGAGFAVRNAKERLPAIFLELRSNQIELKREVAQFAAKVGIQLRNIGLELFWGFNPGFIFGRSGQFPFVKMQAS